MDREIIQAGLGRLYWRVRDWLSDRREARMVNEVLRVLDGNDEVYVHPGDHGAATAVILPIERYLKLVGPELEGTYNLRHDHIEGRVK